MEVKAEFDTFWIIESVSEGDLKIGSWLRDSQFLEAETNHKVRTKYREAHNKTEFLSCFSEILESTGGPQRSTPVVHIDCHGSPDGLVLSNKQIVTWAELAEVSAKICIASRLNFLLTLSACHAAHAISMANYTDRAPFFALIAPKCEVSAGSALQAFKEFYSTYFRTLDANLAIKDLNNHSKNGEYSFIGAGGFFAHSFGTYFQRHRAGKGKRESVEEMVSEFMKTSDGAKALGITATRKIVKRELSNSEDDFLWFKRNYFMIDLFPENKDRFDISFDEVKKLSIDL